jgi:hypothetical protein
MHKEKKWPSKDEGFDRIDIIPFTTDLPVIDVNETLGNVFVTIPTVLD